jgi:hypothetical protein
MIAPPRTPGKAKEASIGRQMAGQPRPHAAFLAAGITLSLNES